MGVAYYAVSGRACRAAATAVARAGNCSGIARAGRRLSVHEANHLVAAGVARAGLHLGRAGRLARCDRPLRLARACPLRRGVLVRSEEHTSELQSLMRISYAVFCL